MSKISIPDRDELLAQFHSANRRAAVWVIIQLVLVIVVGSFVNWNQLWIDPLIPIVAAAVVIGPFMGAIARIWLQSKKEIGDLKETTRYGEFDKHKLRSLFLDTQKRLGLHGTSTPVYITANKDFNAASVRLGVGVLLRFLNGVYLHRQVLHRLTPGEVQNLMGHELGHHHRYFLWNDRFMEAGYILGAFGGIVLAQKMGFTSYVQLVLLSIFAWISTWPSRVIWVSNSRTIEFLCDDFGAQVTGPENSITGLLKAGLDEEVTYAIHVQVLLADSSQKNLSLNERIEAIERAIPYGQADEARLQEAIAAELKKKSDKNKQFSIGGLLKYAWNGDEADDDEEALKILRAQFESVSKRPRIEWESIAGTPEEMNADPTRINRLIELIEANPDSALFSVPEDEATAPHPATRDRILFLWYNRPHSHIRPT